jgi:hypothetical protein
MKLSYSNLKSRFRTNRFVEFLRMLHVDKESKIIDLGGYSHSWEAYEFKYNVTIVNLKLPKHQEKEFHWIEADACNLALIGDKTYDIVFSNSVIEHVGDFSRQIRMANEIRRIGKKYWVQTPYRHFPLEIHFLFPFFQYLPIGLKYLIARIWPFSFAKKLHLDPIQEMQNIWSLDYEQMKKLFPDAILEKEKICGLTKSLIAYRKLP